MKSIKPMRSNNPIYPEINETPRKVAIIGGITRRLVTPLNLYESRVEYVYHHTYATVKLCKLRLDKTPPRV